MPFAAWTVLFGGAGYGVTWVVFMSVLLRDVWPSLT